MIRRAGRVLTGVDRVELAYLREFLKMPDQIFGLARTSFGYVLLDRSGLEEIEIQVSGGAPFPEMDILSRVPRGMTKVQRQAQTSVRRLSVARAIPQKLHQLLADNLPKFTSYINVGHSNLSSRVMINLKQTLDARISVMIHDVIPLDFPHYQRAGTVQTFLEKVKRVQKYADLVIYNSVDTQKCAEVHFGKWGKIPSSIVSHLGTDVIEANALPAHQIAPYFVCVGTIEPRKNHEFLLDIWQELGEGAPTLHICGSRGWNNKSVFDRLDNLPENSSIIEQSNLTDLELQSLITKSRGLLFPSFAEGFGLPAVEAAALGVPILCNDLGVFREILCDIPVYASVSDRYLWIKRIKELATDEPIVRSTKAYIPTSWSDHFNIVLSLI